MIMTIDNEPIRAAEEPIGVTVTRVWRRIGMEQLSPPEQESFLAAETERIEDLIEARVPDQIELTSRYRHERGQQPDYLTTVALINNARNQVRQAVLDEELFSHLPIEQDETEQPMPSLEEATRQRAIVDAERRAKYRNDPDRWKRALHRSEPTPEIVEQVRQLWGDRSPRFRVTAQYLMQARSEDGQPIPRDQTSDLYRSYTSLLEAEMAARGLVADGAARR